MVDEWLGCAVDLHWLQPCEIGWAPVETVSLSEAGFERIYQGSALLLVWPLRLEPGGHWETEIRLSFTRVPGGA
jgi:alpha-amylase